MKLEPNYTSPYVIIFKFNPLNLKIQMNISDATKVVHHNKLERYEVDNPPYWAENCPRK